jgi:hypothetical protein
VVGSSVTVAVSVASTGGGVVPGGRGVVVVRTVPPEDGFGEGTGRDGDEPGKKVNTRLSLAATTTEPSLLMAM